MAIYYIDAAVRDVKKGNSKAALKNLKAAVNYWGAHCALEHLAKIENLARQVGTEEDAKRKAESEWILSEVDRLRPAAELREKERKKADEAARLAEEQRHREAAQERLKAVTASRGTRDITSPRSFEYAVMEMSRREAGDYLNKAGSLGWELVTALPSADGCDTLYLKRDAWLASEESSGKLTASAIPLRTAGAAAGGGMAFAGIYYESGLDMDADGDVDGGLFDNLENLFG